MVILASDLLTIVWQIYNEGWGYIWGASGQIWTAAAQAAATRDATVKYGAKWIGKHVIDCSGIAYYAFKKLGGNMYHGSNTIWNKYSTGRSELKNGKRTDGGALLPMDPVFKRSKKADGTWNRHHIGYYVGGNQVIEAKGTNAGVVISQITEWHETARWKNVEYEGGLIFVAYPTLRKGDSGADVTALQLLLLSHGYDLGTSGAAGNGVDGKFGAKTQAAVKAFQTAAGLSVDGVAGDQTWTALKGEAETATGAIGADQETVRPDCVQIERLKLQEMQACLADCQSIIKNALA